MMPMNRRRFLESRAGASVASVPFLADTPAELCNELTLIRISRRAMATDFEVALPLGTPNALKAAEDALDLIDELEAQLTIYRDDSEVSLLNSRAASEVVPVEAGLFDLLELSASLTRDTAGAFDIATGALIKTWGFYKREGRIPTPKELAGAMGQVGTRHVVMDRQNRSIKYRKAGLEINLGAIGKGYALDRAAQRLRQNWQIHTALLHGGGSSVLAMGCPTGSPQGWGVQLRHPWQPERPLGTIWLKNQALATSAATFQYFEYNGKKYGHVIDPRTGYPAFGVASASVISRSSAVADAISTAVFVLGRDNAEKYLNTHSEYAGLLLFDDEPYNPRLFGLSRSNYTPPAQTISHSAPLLDSW